MTVAPAAELFSEASYPRRREGARKILVIACGALAREALALRLDHIDVACLPAHICINEVWITPTWNRGYVANLQRTVKR